MIDQGDENPTRRRPGPPSDAIMGMANALIDKLGRGAVADETRGDTEVREAVDPEPDRLGRFEVERRLGAGAMGVVYAARDPMLRRDVAIKVLAHDRASEISLVRARREAQAMAQISHPNVVKVFAIGEHEGTLFIAMERIYGRTLAQWQAGRSGGEILDAYRQAGLGLAALHAHELIHRDFKPANAMMGDDGRVQVLDLGLVREIATGSSRDDVSGHVSGSRLSSGSATISDAILGTPAYMSPEQFLGGSVGPAADQFSFCVSLYEALYGHRPFKAKTMTQLAEAIAAQRIEPPPRGSAVPRRIQRVLRRGLSSEPSKRFRSMDALLEALAGRRRVVAWGGAVAVAGLLAAVPLGGSATEDACALSTSWDRAWSPERRAASSLRQLETNAAAIEAQVDAFCERGLARRDDPCLQQVIVRFSAIAGLLEDLPEGLTARTVVRATLSPTLCDQAELYIGHEKELVALADDNSRVDFLALLGDYDRAQELADQVVRRAQQLGHDTLLYESLYQRGKVHARRRALPEANADFIATYEVALIAGAHQATANAASSLVWVTQNMGDLDAAEHWLRVAANVREALTGEPPNGPRYLMRDGELRLLRGKFGEARTILERALKGWKAIDNPREVASVAGMLVEVYVAQSDLDVALTTAREAIAVMTDAHGDAEPQLGTHYLNLGSVHTMRGDHNDALAAHRQAFERRTKAYGADHYSTAVAQCATAASLVALDRDAEARTLVAAALEILPEEDVSTAECNLVLARATMKTEPGKALTRANRAVVTLEAELGHNSIHVAAARVGLAEVEVLAGEPALALEHVRAVRSRLPSGHVVAGWCLHLEGRALATLEREAEAEVVYRQAIELLSEAQGESKRVEKIRASLAEVGGT